MLRRAQAVPPVDAVTRMSELRRMLQGELYDPADPELVRARALAHDRCLALSRIPEAHAERREDALAALLPNAGARINVQPPFFCDYGFNIHTGQHVYFNAHCTVPDACEVRIGSHCLLGPGMQLLTPLHPLGPVQRRGRECRAPITIGDDVWIVGALVLAGVRIGSGAVVGAGSVAARDIPERVLAVGNPCRVLRAV